MPKETIAPFTDDGFGVQLSWSRDRDVQLGMGLDDDTLVRQLLWSKREQLGRAVTHLAKEIPHDIREEWGPLVDIRRGEALLDAIDMEVWFRDIWVGLNRDACNRLVKTLRRARDAVFGHDE